MKFLLTIAAILAATSAFAEDTPSIPVPQERPAPVASAPPSKLYLEVDQADLAAISQALNELPKRIADPLILKLQGQLQAQEPIKVAADSVEKARKRR